MRDLCYRGLLALFFLSGATGLIYEVVWTNLLTLFFGSTTLAVSTVLTAFMSGLAIGSITLGRLADRSARPVRVYAALELFIGLYALATPVLFPLLEKIYISLYPSITGSPSSTGLLRFACAFLSLLLPTAAMGGTLPVLSRFVLGSKAWGSGRVLGVLYSVNTIGAVTGVLGAGMLLLPELGSNWTLITCGIINLGIAMAAWFIDRRYSTTTWLPSRAASEKKSAREITAVAVLFCSGMVALALEVLWTRVLALVIGSTTYAFTIMLATFLIGIASGSAVASRLKSLERQPLIMLILFQGGVALAAMLTSTLFNSLPALFVSLYSLTGGDFAHILLGQLVLGFILMFPATFFMGASFPAAAGVVVSRNGQVGRRTGFIYAGNTIGAILGSFATGFILIPAVGLSSTTQLTIKVGLMVTLLVAIVALWSKWAPAPGQRRWLAGLAGLVVIGLVSPWQPGWDEKLMTSGAHVYADRYQAINIQDRLKQQQLLFYKDGPVATVAVVQEGQRRFLTVDGKTDAGTGEDMITQVLLGGLPLLIRPQADGVLVIGYASGITAGTVSLFEASRIDCVEIEPAMITASRFFDDENYGVIDDPRCRIVLDDARSFLRTCPIEYDVITSEPSNPWQAGSSRLFTREAFAYARARLAPQGIMAQWMHLYWIDTESLQLIIRTFLSVFPHATLWVDPVVSDAILIGAELPVEISPIDLIRTYQTNERAVSSLRKVGYSSAWTVFRAFALDSDKLRAFASEGEINTDDLPLLQYRAPKAMFASDYLAANLDAIRQAQGTSAFPRLGVTPNDRDTVIAYLQNWAQQLARNRFQTQAAGAAAAAIRLDDNRAESYSVMGNVQMWGGNPNEAIGYLRQAIELDPGHGPAHANLGSCYMQIGEPDKANQYLARAIALGEESSDLRNTYAVVLYGLGDRLGAIQQVRRALELNPDNPQALANLKRFQDDSSD
ncbi:MAG: fused MFS/spermidine synthase [Candidatus Zixiibacteriota bacterium]|nr:MAG: fused MFS/spermidine synthase [candidate division Zixibacteria bacterium]